MKKIWFKSSVLLPVAFVCYIFERPISLCLPTLNLYLWRDILPFLMLLYTTLWLVCFPNREIFRTGDIFELCFNILPVEILLLLIFAQWHFILAVVFVLLVAGAALALNIALSVQSLPIRATWKQYRRRKIAGKRVFLVIAVVLLAIPSAASLFLHELRDPEYEASRKIQEKIFPEEQKEEKQEDPLAEHIQLLQCFQEKTWKKYSVQEQITVLQGLVDLEAQRLGMPTVKITTTKLSLFILGQYSKELNEIQIDLQHMKEAAAQEVVSTCLHEIYHAFQAYVVEHVDWDTDFANSSFFDEARQWKDNSSRYINGFVDYDAYAEQPLEASAEAFAEKEGELIFSYIARYVENGQNRPS